MNERPNLQLLCGGGDMIAVLEDAIEHVKRGSMVGLVLCAVSQEGGPAQCHWTWAHHDDLENAWATLVASTANAQHGLLGDMI